MHMALREAKALRDQHGRNALQRLVSDIFQAARAKDEHRLARLEKVRTILTAEEGAGEIGRP